MSRRQGAADSRGKMPIFAFGAALICAVLVAIQPAARTQGEEAPLEAAVTVIAPTTGSHAASVYDAHRCHNTEQALGEPDGDGVVLWPGGQITVELERAIADCTQVSIWAAQAGWGAAKLKVQVSADAKRWRQVGHLSCTSEYARHDLGGDFGTVRYVRVSRTGSWFALPLLDAVWVGRR